MNSGADRVGTLRDTRNMSAHAPQAAIEPTGTLRIARACSFFLCGAVYYVASVTDAPPCPVCGTRAGEMVLVGPEGLEPPTPAV